MSWILANYFQNEEECPKDDNNNNICYYSKYIKVGFYRGTTETVSKGRCGLKEFKILYKVEYLQLII